MQGDVDEAQRTWTEASYRAEAFFELPLGGSWLRMLSRETTGKRHLMSSYELFSSRLRWKLHEMQNAHKKACVSRCFKLKALN